MKKRLIIISIIVLAVLAGIRIYYWVRPVARNSSIVRAVPVDAAFFFQLNKPGALEKKFASLPYYSSLKGLSFYNKTNDLFSQLMPMINQQEGWKNAFFNQTIITSFHLTRADNFEVVLIASLSKARKPDFATLFNSLSNSISYNKRNVMNNDVYDVRFKKSGKNLTIAYIDETIIISAESSLAEDALGQMAGRASLFEQENFAGLEKKSAENFDVVLYFNYKYLAEFFGGFANIQSQPLVSSMSRFASWTEVDLSLEKNGINFRGNTTAAKTEWLSYFTKEAIQNNFGKNISPENSAILLQLGLSPKNGIIDKLSPATVTDAEFNKYIRPWLGNQMALLLTEPINDNFLPQSFLLLEAVNESLSSQLLNSWAFAKANADTIERFVYKGKVIQRLNVGGLFNKYFSSSLVQLKDPYFTLLDRTVIFSNSQSQLKLLLDKYADGNTLKKKTSAELSISSQYSVYMDLSRMKDFLRALGSDALVASLAGGFDLAKQFSPLQINYSYGKDFYRTTGSVAFSGAGSVTEDYLWKTSLDTTAIMAPQLVYAANGEDRMVVTQDINNQMYLLNKGGDIVWKKKLDAPIMGKISQIDFYGNGQLEMVFATEGKIYLMKMDRNAVNNFPITLSARATSPLKIIDYDGVRQYKFFVACANGSVYGFEKSGKPLTGWNPNSGIGAVHLPIEFYKASGKEFLMTVNDNGSLLFFSRDGRRVANEMKLKTQFNFPFVLIKGNLLAAVDTSGKVFHLGMDGKMSTDNLVAEGRGITGTVTSSGNDTAVDYALMNATHIWGTRNDGDFVFDYDFENQSEKELFLLKHPLTREAAIGVSDTYFNQIYLFDRTGNLYPSFPKQGSSAFIFEDLFGNKGKVIVTVVNGSEVIAYGL